MNRYLKFLLLCLTACLAACVSEEELIPTGEGGRLRLSLTNVSTATSRANPTELGVPGSADFRLQIANEAGRVVYDDVFTENEITLPVGTYTVMVSYGGNDLLALDKPYYYGETTAVVSKDETTHASITARVGNALVSAIFGRNPEEQERFNRYYSDYALYVYIGNHGMPITKDEPLKSVYVQAGSHVTLRFWGKLRMEDDREVSGVLESKDFPDVLNAADHAIVTLSLPDPETALGVDISKVEVETVTMDETIPLSWLPVPTLTPSLQFDRYGMLVGTLLTSSDGYPGMTWKAVVTNAAGEEVRTMQGTGVLTSGYISSTAWPYLPQGTYKATYYIISEDGTASKASSREFIIPAPTGLEVTVSGYTSYSKYLEGKIDEANACDRLTIYEPSVYVNVASSLLSHSNYRDLYTFTYTYDGTTNIIEKGANSYETKELTGQKVRSYPYVLKGNIIFDGASASAQKEFRITGLPVSYTPPTQETGWVAQGSPVKFNDSDVQLGRDDVNFETQSIYCKDFAIPGETYLQLLYDVKVVVGARGTTFKIMAGTTELYSQTEEGTGVLLYSKEYPASGSTTNILSNFETVIRCDNSYGEGMTRTHIYSLTFEYGKP